MYVQSAEDLRVDAARSTLRLVKVNPQTLYFSDRPKRIAGHPDKGGSEADRQRLSSQRAEAIRLQLIGMGVPSILVSASGNPRSTWEDGRAELVIHPVIGGWHGAGLAHRRA